MRRELIVAVMLLPALFLTSAYSEEAPEAPEVTEVAEAPTGLLGDASDGSRAHPTHLIPLIAENEEGGMGAGVALDADVVMPFSTKWTCGQCHSYDLIKQGWHFNAIDSNTPTGRPGEPWIYYDSKLGIQVPLSYRAWPGTHQPGALGLTAFRFTTIFGRHMPGGGPGEVAATDMDDIGRQYVSGKLPINCLTCHNGHYGQDQGGVNGWAMQVSAKENFRWAAAASCEFASVKGAAKDMSEAYDPFMPEGNAKEPQVIYRPEAFDEDGQVLFNIVRKSPNERCYYCHSDVYYSKDDEETEKWSCDEDIHLTAGLTCVDCHRNGIDHDIVRGYPGESETSTNALTATMSCKGCHLPEGSDVPEAGRLGAPIPTHVGLPPVHFERLTCTACHSGPWPGDETVLTKTSRTHRLGTPNVNKAEEVLPHVVSPVFAEENGQIAPYKMVWPAYWGAMADDDVVTPVEIAVVEDAVKGVFEALEVPANGSWPGITKEQIGEALTLLVDVVEGTPVYVAGGTLYRLGDANDVAEEADHPAAKPYRWPIAHNVRPAAQALGIRYCTDCHATDGPFFFGDVTVDSPVAAAGGVTKKQVAFQKISPFYAWAFAFSFVFRPWFKVVALGASAILGLVLLLYGLRALGSVAKTLAEEE